MPWKLWGNKPAETPKLKPLQQSAREAKLSAFRSLRESNVLVEDHLSTDNEHCLKVTLKTHDDDLTRELANTIADKHASEKQVNNNSSVIGTEMILAFKATARKAR
jgi:hypothetical protein